MLVGYARVSTRDQNLDLQEIALNKAGCGRIFCDKASGASMDARTGLRDALAFLRDNQGDCLVVWKLDRLARSLRDLIKLSMLLKSRGIMLKSTTENIDTTTPAGEMYFHMMGVIAEFERNLIRERTQAGLDRARALGRLNGRPKALTTEKMATAQKMLVQGLPYREVAAALNVSRITLYRHLPYEMIQNLREAPIPRALARDENGKFKKDIG